MNEKPVVITLAKRYRIISDGAAIGQHHTVRGLPDSETAEIPTLA